MKISKKMAGIAAVVVAAVLIIGIVAVMTLRIDSREAQNIALEQSGGGEVIASEVSSEGLWNEYSYTIQNGDRWYQIEISGFGNVEEIESGTGIGWRD